MRVVVLGFVILFGSIPALAYSTGPPSHEDGENGLSCASCHFQGSNVTPPSIDVTGLDGPFTSGDIAHLTLTVTGTQTAAGFEAGTDGDTGGTFALGSGTGTRLTDSNHEIEHSSPQTYANGVATWTFDLTVATGSHTLYVAANDVNRNFSSSGDFVGTKTFTYTVAPGAGGEGEGEGEGATGGEGEGATGGEGEGATGGEGEGATGGEGEGEGEGAANSPGCSSTATSSGVPAAALVALGFVALRLGKRRR